MKADTKVKKRILLYGAIAGLILCYIATNSNSYNKVLGADVNPENGDVAFIVEASSNCYIYLADQNGTLLFSKKIPKEGKGLGRGVQFGFVFDADTVLVYSVSKEEAYRYDREGNIKETISDSNDPSTKEKIMKQWTNYHQWDNWENANGMRSFERNGVQYHYSEAPFYLKWIRKGWSELSIQTADKKVIIYRSEASFLPKY